MGHRVLGAPDRSVVGRCEHGLAERVVVLLRDAEQVGDHQQGERHAELADELALPRPTNSSITRSASRHMKSSFSFSRLGVSWRISSERWSLCLGGSIVGQLVAERQLVAVLLDELAEQYDA